jgi:hypothetical protein
MKVGDKGLRMSSGEVRHFGSEKKRDNFERVAEAVKHGFKPNKAHAAHRESHCPPSKERCK